MIQRIGKKKFKIFAFDLESHNDEESKAKKETSMWLGCFIDETSKIDDDSSYIYKMKELIKRLEEESKQRYKGHKRLCKNVCVYIYNLSFEWSFILPELLKYGFKFKETIEDEDEFVFNSVSTRSVSSVWQVQLKFSKKSGTIYFRDLAKIYGGGLGKVAKAFNLETQKGEIDYNLNRLHDYVITKEEKEYCFKDTRIIIDVLLKIIENNDRTFWNITSMASYSMKKLIKFGYPKAKYQYKAFREDYLELDEEETEFLRKGVEGGITYAPSRWQFKNINCKILHIDKHQMHPSSAYFNYFPYGKGEYKKGKPHDPFKIQACRIRISYDSVKLHSIIKLIGIEFIEDFELVVWNFEIPVMKKCYVNLRIEYIDYYEYKIKPLKFRKYFSANYWKRLEARKAKDEYNTLLYKLLNNSSYGKLLEKPHNEIIENIINEDGIITSNVSMKSKSKVNAKYTYLPVGSAIPAYSRCDLILSALKFGWKKILYFDTDSIFVIYDDEVKKIWESDEFDKVDFLGGWALEEICDRAQFTAPKRYKLQVGNEIIVKMAGINFNREFDYDEINIISSSWDVQRAYRVKGGTIIDLQRKDVQVQSKYMNNYLNNKDE